MSTAPYIPTEEDINQQSTIKTWRISDGLIRYGAGEGDETMNNIVLLPTRIGLTEEFTNRAGKTITQKFRIEGMTKDGERVRLQCGLLGPSKNISTIAKGLMLILRLWDQKSFISFTVKKSEKPNKYNNFLTFIDGKQCEGPNKWVELRPSADDWKLDDEDLVVECDNIPIWEDFLHNDNGALSPYDALSDWLEDHGFERYTGQAVYDTVLKKGFRVTEVSQLTAEQWTEAPKMFEKALKQYGAQFPKKAAKPEPADEYDPFADE